MQEDVRMMPIWCWNGAGVMATCFLKVLLERLFLLGRFAHQIPIFSLKAHDEGSQRDILFSLGDVGLRALAKVSTEVRVIFISIFLRILYSENDKTWDIVE